VRRRGALAVAAAAIIAGSAANADWLQPDISYREAQLVLRLAARDTTGRGTDPARLDSLGVALLRLGRLKDAESVFRRAAELAPGDDQAEAGLGKIALFQDRLAEAESLLAGATSDPGAAADLFAARARLGKYEKAAEMAADVNQAGRAELLRRMADHPIYQITSGPQQMRLSWSASYPVPLVRAKLNGVSVLMALDTGAADVLIDASAARRCRVDRIPGDRPEFWCGSRLVVGNAMVQKLEIGGMRIERLPAGILSLRKWSLELHPHAEPVVGVIGLNFMRRFTTTLDYKTFALELRQPGTPFNAGPNAQRVGFQMWGENELTVQGSLAGGRTMALVVQSGVPGCGIGAPVEVTDEIGVRAGVMSRIAKGAGTWLQGRSWTAVVIPTVTVGPVAKDKVTGWRGALDSSELWRHGVRRDALLSGDFFRGRRVTIDWRAHELIFED